MPKPLLITWKCVPLVFQPNLSLQSILVSGPNQTRCNLGFLIWEGRIRTKQQVCHNIPVHYECITTYICALLCTLQVVCMVPPTLTGFKFAMSFPTSSTIICHIQVVLFTCCVFFSCEYEIM